MDNKKLFEKLLSKKWWLSNGNGGYLMFTRIIGDKIGYYNFNIPFEERKWPAFTDTDFDWEGHGEFKKPNKEDGRDLIRNILSDWKQIK